jgi:hypothetical protein
MRLFLSYRRGDSAGHTGRLSDTLAARLGADHVFQDVETVSAGADFVKTIGAELDRSDAVLAVIGPTWASATGPDGASRLRDPNDYVRSELVNALQRDVPVVPVLVGGATIPPADALPEDLQPLLHRQAVTLRDASWQRDVDGLLDSLRGERAQAPGKKARRRVFLGAAAVALAAVIGVVVVVSTRGGGGSASSPPACPATKTAGLTQRQLSANPSASEPGDGGGNWLFTVLDAYERPTGAGTWQLLLKMRLTNNSRNSVYHADYRYGDVAVAGTPFQVACFTSEAGGSVVAPGLNSEAVVGFNVSKDPAQPLELILDGGTHLPFAS